MTSLPQPTQSQQEQQPEQQRQGTTTTTFCNNKSTMKVSSNRFYGEYHGHKVKHLEALYPRLREASDTIIWTAGDSSLDNKVWFSDPRPAVGPYQDVLQPPTSNADVTYWLNYLCEQDSSAHRNRTVAINTAVEATTLNERCFRLRPQDRFIRDNIQRDDVLIVSVGGNDVAMAPMPCTIAAMLGILCLPSSCVEKGCACGAVPTNDCCCGCGPSLVSCVCACPPCLGYFHHLFGVRLEKYIQALTSKTRPKKILVCMIYYPDETLTPSWAGLALGALGYNKNPERLQMFIRKVFSESISSVRIPGSKVIPTALFHALDGKNSRDYIARVEPSSEGGRKMAEYLLDVIDNGEPTKVASPSSPANSASPIQASYMSERS